ncbi:PREDICTED: Retrovirus-related Pol poly from, partial [Prunus dulcis]
NGLAESKNGQILAAAGAPLLGASVPKQLWMDVVTCAVYLLNRLPSRILDIQTPMQVLNHHIYASSMLTLSPKVFDCVVYVHLHQNQR